MKTIMIQALLLIQTIMMFLVITLYICYAYGIIQFNTVWEYKTVEVYPDSSSERTGDDALKFQSITPSINEINSIGEEGWELVTSYLEIETAFPNFGDDKYVSGLQPNVRPQRVVLMFKRSLGKKLVFEQ